LKETAMIRPLVSGIAALTVAVPPSRDTDTPALTGPIPLTDAEIDQIAGGSKSKAGKVLVRVAAKLIVAVIDAIADAKPHGKLPKPTVYGVPI
jgi:hypothetical protein